MQEEGQPQTVELVRHLRVEEGQEPAHIIHAVHLCRVARQHPLWQGQRGGTLTLEAYLRAERGLLMEVAPHEVTVLA